MTKRESVSELVKHARPGDPMAGELATICVDGLFQRFKGIHYPFDLAVSFLCPLMNQAVTLNTIFETAKGMIDFAGAAAEKTVSLEKERNA